MARRRGRAPKGQRLPAAIPWGHWQTTTFVAGLRTTGLTAPMVIEGAMDGDAFKAYVKQLLVPSLKPRDIVIMDNLSSHRWCQSNANQSPKHLKLRRSRRQLTPFGQRGGAIFFEGFAAVEMTFEIEMIVDRSMN